MTVLRKAMGYSWFDVTSGSATEKIFRKLEESKVRFWWKRKTGAPREKRLGKQRTERRVWRRDQKRTRGTLIKQQAFFCSQALFPDWNYLFVLSCPLHLHHLLGFVVRKKFYPCNKTKTITVCFETFHYRPTDLVTSTKSKIFISSAFKKGTCS